MEFTLNTKIDWPNELPEADQSPALRQNPRAYKELMERIAYAGWCGISYAMAYPELNPFNLNILIHYENPAEDEVGYLPVVGMEQMVTTDQYWGLIVYVEIEGDGTGLTPIYRDTYGELGVYI